MIDIRTWFYNEVAQNISPMLGAAFSDLDKRISNFFYPPLPPKTFFEQISEHITDRFVSEITRNKLSIAKETINEATKKAGLFIQENSSEVALGAATVGSFALIQGTCDLSKGNKKRGIGELALSAIGLGSAAYIQQEALVQPLVQIIQPYLNKGKEWVNSNIEAFPEATSIIGVVGGGTLALGVNQLAKGNKKKGLVGVITGLAGIALGIHGLLLTRNGTCPAPIESDTCPAL